MDEIANTKKGETERRWKRAGGDKAFDTIRNVLVVETRAEHFLHVLQVGTVSSNVYLRRIQNFALGMNWLGWPVIPKRHWPKIAYKTKRAITAEEHQRIVKREQNCERRAFYQLSWHLGGSQTDIAKLTAEDVDWTDHTICYDRQKLKSQETQIKPPLIHFSTGVEKILRSLPQSGFLFPYLRTLRSSDRATEFKQRCDGLQIKGVTLHSYRYAWAERARKAGYPMRFAQEALGHNSKAVHYAYSRKAEVRVPSLEDWERKMQEKVVAVKFGGETENRSREIRCEESI